MTEPSRKLTEAQVRALRNGTPLGIETLLRLVRIFGSGSAAALALQDLLARQNSGQTVTYVQCGNSLVVVDLAALEADRDA